MELDFFETFIRLRSGAASGSTTRRGLTRLLGGVVLSGPLALRSVMAGEAKRKKHCGPCKRRKKGKCKPKATGTPCAGGACQGGVCIPAAPLSPAVLTEVACAGPREGRLTGARRLAQTFTANASGTIGTAEVEFDHINKGTDFLFEIRTVDEAGVPTASVLGNDEHNNLPASGSITRVTAKFIPAVPVTAKTTYALVVTDVSADGFIVNTRQGGCAGGVFADSFANGDFFPVGGNDLDLIFSVAP